MKNVRMKFFHGSPNDALETKINNFKFEDAEIVNVLHTETVLAPEGGQTTALVSVWYEVKELEVSGKMNSFGEEAFSTSRKIRSLVNLEGE